MVKTSSTYLSQVSIVNEMGNSGPQALFSKYSIDMFATMGEHGEPIAKDLSPGEVKLLQRGPKFTVTSP